MKTEKGVLLLALIVFFAGCTSTSSLDQQRSYRDPITYSFEAYTPHPKDEKDPFSQFLTGIKETSRQIKEWEEKHLW